MPVNVFAKLVEKTELKPDIFKFSVESKEISSVAKPGQFLEIKVSETNDPFLRRPISIYNIDNTKNIVEFIFQIKGQGTQILSKREVRRYDRYSWTTWKRNI